MTTGGHHIKAPQLAGRRRQRTLRLGADTSAAGKARAFVRATLRTWGVPTDQHGDVLLAVSELVSNAVQHGDGDPRLQLRLEGRGKLHVRVRDAAPREPLLRDHDPRSERGRGLLIVNSVADEWGRSIDDCGKWVWAVFALVGADARDESAS